MSFFGFGVVWFDLVLGGIRCFVVIVWFNILNTLELKNVGCVDKTLGKC